MSEIAPLRRAYRSSYPVGIGLFAFLAAVSAYLFFLRNAVLVDDNYITYRVVRNVVNGIGFVFSDGDAYMPVTSPLWTMLLAASSWMLGIADLVTLGKSIGVGLLCIAAFLLYDILRSRFGSLAALSTPVVFFAAQQAEGVGNEVPLVIACGFAAVWTYQIRNNLSLTGVFLGLTYLARGDGAVLLIAIVAYHFIRNFRRVGVPQIVRDTSYLVLVFFLVILPWHAYYAWTFGEIFPKSLRVKMLQGRSSYWPQYHEYIFPYALKSLQNNLTLLGASAFGVVSLARISPILLIWCLGHVIAYTLLRVPNYEWYYYPLFLLVGTGLCVAGLRLVDALTAGESSGANRGRGYAICLLVALLAIGDLFGIRNLEEARRFASSIRLQHEDENERYRAYRQVADWLRTNLDTSNQPLVMAFEIGIIGYFAPSVRFIDPPGILRKDVDRMNMNNWGYIVRKYKPDYLIFRELSEPKVIVDDEGNLTGATYRLVGKVDASFYHQSIYRLEKKGA